MTGRLVAAERMTLMGKGNFDARKVSKNTPPSPKKNLGLPAGAPPGHREGNGPGAWASS